MSLASRGSSHGPLRGVGSAGRDVLRLALGHEQRVLHRRRPGHDAVDKAASATSWETGDTVLLLPGTYDYTTNA